MRQTRRKVIGTPGTKIAIQELQSEAFIVTIAGDLR